MRKRKNKSLIFLIALTSFLLAGLSSCTDLFDDAGSELSPHISGNPNAEIINNNVIQIQPDPESDDITDSLCSVVMDTLKNYESDFTVDRILTTEDVKAALRQLTDKAPDLFWTNGYCLSTSSSSDECQVTFYTLDDHTPEELMKMHDELEKAADEIISGIPEDSTDYEKILFVHDYIVDNTDYDFDGAKANENGIYGTAYGCLVNRNAVCQGYAEAFQYIMNKIGIESGICTGDADSVPHAWNYVKANGEYYWIDVTWDDPQSEEDDEETDAEIRHTYFLINDKMMFRTRYVDDEYADIIPECTCLDENYYMKKGALFNDYSIEKIAELVSQDDGSRKLEMMFRDEYAYNQAKECLFEGNEILLLDDYTELNDTINWAYDDDMYELFIYY